MVYENKGKNVWLVEMSYPWVQNHDRKDEEKTAKSSAMGTEESIPKLIHLEQSNIVIDVL